MWCRAWFDPVGRQTRLASLGVEDLERAKELLVEWVNEHGKFGKSRAEDIALAQVIQRYYLQKVKHMPAKSRGTQRRCLELMTELAGHLTVSEFKLAKQAEIVRTLKDRGYAPGYIKRIFSATRAALNWAYKNEEIDRVPPPCPLPDSPPREFVATPAQLARLWDALEDSPGDPSRGVTPVYRGHLRMFFILAISTGARHRAILDLTRFQCDFEKGLIDLNPPGRERTNKRRAHIPMTALAREWIATVPAGPLVNIKGKPITSSVIQGWNAARARAGLPKELTPHSIRHTVATWCRLHSVDPWLVETFCGWREPGRRTIDRYAKYDPAYFAPVIAAIDRLFEEVGREAKTSLKPGLRASSVRVGREKWWAQIGSNYRPPPCQGGALPLSYAP
ncbi:MAG: hypothetical protein Kow00133_18550 [Amphiplicatus sp.]